MIFILLSVFINLHLVYCISIKLYGNMEIINSYTLWKYGIHIPYIYDSIISRVYGKICFHGYKLSELEKRTIYIHTDDTLKCLKKWREGKISIIHGLGISEELFNKELPY